MFSLRIVLVESALNSVLDAATILPLGRTVSDRNSKLVASLSSISPLIRNLLANFPGIVHDGSTTPKPLHGVEHSVEMKGRLLWAKSHRLDPNKLHR
jgi:hypothetical protein